jgi:hypothetical protein
MSSLRKIQSSKSNGALSKGPTTPAGKERSKLNALRHGMCAKCIVLDHESRENFLILMQQHSDLFRPANEVEVGMIEEMCAAYWRQRRAWTIETALLEKQIALQPGETAPERMAAAFDHLAAAPTLPLLHRYETRQHLMYQRAMRTLIMLRTIPLPNDPSPISEHSPPVAEQPPPVAEQPPPVAEQPPPPQQSATDSEPLSGPANPSASPACSPLSAGYHSPQAAPKTPSHVPAQPPTSELCGAGWQTCGRLANRPALWGSQSWLQPAFSRLSASREHIIS